MSVLLHAMRGRKALRLLHVYCRDRKRKIVFSSTDRAGMTTIAYLGMFRIRVILCHSEVRPEGKPSRPAYWRDVHLVKSKDCTRDFAEPFADTLSAHHGF